MPPPRRSLPCTTIIHEKLIDLVLFFIFAGYETYRWIAIQVLILFFPLTKRIVTSRFKNRFGLEVDGPNPWDPHIFTKRAYARMAVEGHYGLLEASSIDESIEVKDLRGLYERALMSGHIEEVGHPLNFVQTTFNLQTRGRCWEVGKQHYDDASDVILNMLDKNRQYSCGYWRTATTLDEAQLAKLDLIARKLQIKPGMRVLDIGCGYGTLAKHLAAQYGASVVGVTISEQQITYARENCVGLQCEFRLCDYRDLRGERFDRVVSVGMFEHVGARNYEEFLSLCQSCLPDDDGLLLLHTVGTVNPFFRRDWACFKHIFRNSELPVFTIIANAIGKSWVVEDWHNFGSDYALTLEAWEKKFDEIWPKVKHTVIKPGDTDDDGETFYRVWKGYLQVSQALFGTRSTHLWQIVLSKKGLKGGYASVR